MLLLIVGLTFILAAIWLMVNNYVVFGIMSFVAGMAATHYGWKKVQFGKANADSSAADENQDE